MTSSVDLSSNEVKIPIVQTARNSNAQGVSLEALAERIAQLNVVNRQVAPHFLEVPDVPPTPPCSLEQEGWLTHFQAN